jgi:hypothetical protein
VAGPELLGPDNSLLIEPLFSFGTRIQDFGLDRAGNVYMTGGFSGSIELGEERIVPAPPEAAWIYVAKSAAGGGEQWLRAVGSGLSDNQTLTRALAVDENDNVYIAGSVLGHADFGGGALPNAEQNARHAFVASYGGDGTWHWADSETVANPNSSTLDVSESSALAVGATAIYAAGSGREDWPACQPQPGFAPNDGCFFLTAYEKASGAIQWSASFPVTAVALEDTVPIGFVWATDVAVDAQGRIYVAGRWAGRLAFGGDDRSEVTSQRDGGAIPQNGFVASYTPDGGTLRWVHTFPGGYNQVNALTTDAEGNVYAAGSIQGSTDPGGGVRGDPDDQNGALFVVSYDSAGQYRFDIVARNLSTASSSIATGITFLGDSVYVLGRHTQQVAIGSRTLDAQTTEALLLGLDRITGSISSMTVFGGAATITTGTMRVSQGQLVFAAHPQGVLQLGSVTLEPLSSTTSHLLRATPPGASSASLNASSAQ